MKVFISYRRSDAADVAGRIFDRLQTVFGGHGVFKDVDSIPIGADFEAAIIERLTDCDAVIVVIGKTWSAVTRQDGSRRLDDPRDYVRIEVEQALQRQIPLIPALVGNADMPLPEQLPESIRTLTRRNAIFIRPDPDFHRDMDRLIQGLHNLGRQQARNPVAQPMAAVSTRPTSVADLLVEGEQRVEAIHSSPPGPSVSSSAPAKPSPTDTAAHWFLCAGLANLAILLAFFAGAVNFGIITSVLLTGGVLGPPAVFQFLAHGCMMNRRGKGKIITANICGLVVGLLLFFFAIAGTSDLLTPDLLVPRAFALLLVLVAVGGTFFNFRSTFHGIQVLKNPVLRQDFDRPLHSNETPRSALSKKLLIGLAAALAGWFLLCLLIAGSNQRNLGSGSPKYRPWWNQSSPKPW